jgi:hypothetical protein
MSKKCVIPAGQQLQEDNPLPTIVMDDATVKQIPFNYPTRGPGDYVVSGPISGKSTGKGREFISGSDAEEWGRAHYGARFKYRIFDAEKGGRWALLIAKLG